MWPMTLNDLGGHFMQAFSTALCSSYLTIFRPAAKRAALFVCFTECIIFFNIERRGKLLGKILYATMVRAW